MAPRRRVRALAAHIVGSRPAAAELAVDELAYTPYVHGSAPDPNEEVPASPWHDVPLFDEEIFPGLTAEQKATMDMDGHVVLPGILTEDTVQRLISHLDDMNVLDQVVNLQREPERKRLEKQRDEASTPEEKAAAERKLQSWADDGSLGMRLSVSATIAEHDPYIESCVGHPQMLKLARAILGDDIRFDHCCNASGRQGGDEPNEGMGYHGHRYADGTRTWEEAEELPDDPNLGFIRIFFVRAATISLDLSFAAFNTMSVWCSTSTASSCRMAT